MASISFGLRESHRSADSLRPKQRQWQRPAPPRQWQRQRLLQWQRQGSYQSTSPFLCDRFLLWVVFASFCGCSCFLTIIQRTIRSYITSCKFTRQFLSPLKFASESTPQLSQNALTHRRNGPPQRHRLGVGGLGIPQQRLELMGVQPEGGWFRIGRPPGKAPGGKAFLTQPKALPVVIGQVR